MLATVALLLFLYGTSAIQLRNNALAHIAHAQAQQAQQQQQQPAPLSKYDGCNCSNVDWNAAVETWSYHPDHPNLSVEYH
jgi:hypothetical protein